MLTTLQRSALVLHSADDMFRLVNDVESYPQFMEGCEGAAILEQGDNLMVARLDLRKAGVAYSFTTRNELHPGKSIRLNLHSGPFRQLRGEWTFAALTAEACKVSLHLEFEINNSLASVAASSLFASVANKLVAAVTRRADTLYGKTVNEFS